MATESQIVRQTRAKMQKTLETIVHEFSTVRTGKANPALLDVVRVEAYGSKVPISQVANVTAPEPAMLLVQPWDKSTIGAIDKAIRLSDLGLNPTNDGNVIRIALPPLTEERRKEYVKIVHKMAEDGRIVIRNERRDAIEELRKMEKAKQVSEDDSRRDQKEIQTLTDEFIKKVDAALAAKEKEIMEV
ncbi:MAG TPA: ribosome recycling factor [Candidatus Latescibacteria bacterium]|jgi:ribosome recycling factor|nr:ribosome recycling factor [Candidatus Latescibacterota bacterium]HPC46178.1 ribosome recycling factor [Candidatus Latescibacterota bacterium]HQK22186.1 ribosome recycling factor [Candidatus Latescibacterota bacterium]HRS95855.1 ribosome recycling factor [Candidatus Latescibacterota bacterium]